VLTAGLWPIFNAQLARQPLPAIDHPALMFAGAVALRKLGRAGKHGSTTRLGGPGINLAHVTDQFGPFDLIYLVVPGSSSLLIATRVTSCLGLQPRRA
jgi:hypothetical protein